MSVVPQSHANEANESNGSGFAALNGGDFYRIADVDQMPPFFVNVVSHCDVWMYVSSRGGLSAGRVDADGAVFPYETVDRIHESHPHSGGCTQFWVRNQADERCFWEPFADLRPGDSPVRRNLYKSLVGNELVFEEFDEATQLTYRSRWAATDSLGIVRTTEVCNTSDQPVSVSILDGFRNVLPWGIPRGTYQFASCLTDAYKRSECDDESGLGIFAVTSGISDGTHPVEVLRSNVVWSVGLPKHKVCLSDRAVHEFRNQRGVQGERLSAGRRGNYFIATDEQSIEPGATIRWHLVADVGYDHTQVVELREKLLNRRPDSSAIETAINAGTKDLKKNIASADGLQHSADQVASVHHFANVLFNNMRGGVFANNHRIETRHFVKFVEQRNTEVAARHRELLQSLSEEADLGELSSIAKEAGDVDLQRLLGEYLPIKFSRRHGDPSRPWNQFAIRLKDADGQPQMKFEGNWRDIFQNWEGLCASFPEFLESVVSKFVNGTTVDGFNPYRVTSEGMEWEELDPEDPWSNIGYWGDHQIIYLLKLLESLRDRAPNRLDELLGNECFAYLDVPYRLKSYEHLVDNARDTITFDKDRAGAVAARVQVLGEDGKLLPDGSGKILYVNLTEKLLVPMLSKLSNFVLDGGIWMNTQRPEWNDANNALVGAGVSVVTLCYLRRYLDFCERLFKGADDREFAISGEVVGWFESIRQAWVDFADRATGSEAVDDATRREFLDLVGQAFSDYRESVYRDGMSSGASKLNAKVLAEFCAQAKKFADHSIRRNRREDSLYHAYNLIEFSQGSAAVRHLYEMLEGQVAVLSSGSLSPQEAADLLDVLFLSRIYREDQKSFMLYPERQIADFLDRNVIPESGIEQNQLLRTMVEAGDRSIASRDKKGVYRFQADFRHRNDLEDRLNGVADSNPQWKELVSESRDDTLALFDSVFQHQSYTGRSGTMYGYEGIGCIYWHMVSKLLLAVQENYFAAVESNDIASAIRLKALYYRVRGGLGPAKTPEEFGAFPTDPYSHTPGHAGARQPGMTGQVKEEILTRFGELGARVVEGQLEFYPRLLSTSELMAEESSFDFVDVHGNETSLTVPAQGMAFTYCQVPICYQQTNESPGIEVRWTAGDPPLVADSARLDVETTRQILSRNGMVASVHVRFLPSQLLS